MSENYQSYPSWIQALSAIAGLFLGCSALVHSCSVSNSTNSLERAKIRPIATYRFNQKEKEIWIEIVNIGLGPAYIRGVQMSFGGQLLELVKSDHNKTVEALKAHIASYDPTIRSKVAIDTEEIIPPFYLGAGQPVEIVRYRFPSAIVDEQRETIYDIKIFFHVCNTLGVDELNHECKIDKGFKSNSS